MRVLQDGEFSRVGGTQTIHVDVRVIVATNRNLEIMVEQGKFREDLFYRLNVFPIHNIPLRDRKDDIPLLVSHFIEKFNKKLGRNVREVSQSVMEKLMDYDYPGNIRELENIIERSLILSKGKTLSGDFHFRKMSRKRRKTFLSMDDLQKTHIREALRLSRGKITGKGGAAEKLRMKDKTLYSRMRKMGINRTDFLD